MSMNRHRYGWHTEPREENAMKTFEQFWNGKGSAYKSALRGLANPEAVKLMLREAFDAGRFSAAELADALRSAAEAHHAYEARTGKPDANWADWYADFIVNGEPYGTWMDPAGGIHDDNEEDPAKQYE